MAVGQGECLTVVTDLEELFRAAVHRADQRVGRRDDVVVEREAQAQQSVGRGVGEAEVGDERLGSGDDVHPGCERPDAQGHLATRHARIVADERSPSPRHPAAWAGVGSGGGHH